VSGFDRSKLAACIKEVDIQKHVKRNAVANPHMFRKRRSDTASSDAHIPLTMKNNILSTRMWANAQHDGRTAEYSWRPLFNAAKFG